MKNGHSEVSNPQRRKLLGGLVAIINLGLFSALFGPLIAFIGSPLKKKKAGRWIPVLEESELPLNSVKEVTFTVKVEDGYHIVDRAYTVFLKRNDNNIVCIDPACTHLGCRIKHQTDSRRFICPCHGGVFDEDGNVVSGPPPKPLERHDVKIEDGKIWIYREA